MTTAARPTWTPAMGGRSIRDNPSHPVTQYGVHDLPSHTTLKFRQPGQNTADEIRKRDLREELRRAELEYLQEKGSKKTRLSIRDVAESDVGSVQDLDEVAEVSATARGVEAEEIKRVVLEKARQLDADDSASEASDSEEESDDEDDDDDSAELLRELEKIRRERAEEKERIEREKEAEEAELREQEVITGNPLLNQDFTVKRRWDDDVVFKNQARGLNDKPKKRFVNDLLRSDFHRKFMSKYVK